MPKTIPAVKAILQKPNGTFLIMRQVVPDGRELWNLPGGKVFHGEDPNDSLVREVLEETGISIDLEQKDSKCLGMWHFTRTDGDQIIATTFLYPVSQETKVGEASNPTNEKVAGFEWVTKTDFLRPEYVTSDESLKRLIAKYI